jgi:twinkle protein
MDVKGTGALTDMPDNVMAVWRNIPASWRSAKRIEWVMRASTKTNRPRSISASMIRLLKQREGEGWIGDIGANLTRSHQFLEGEKNHLTTWSVSRKASLILSGKPAT